MDNLGKYRQCFCEVFSLDPDFDIDMVKMGGTPDWDSVGHMELVTEMEDKFDIVFETEDILKFTSYIEGMEILKKYGIEIERGNYE